MSSPQSDAANRNFPSSTMRMGKIEKFAGNSGHKFSRLPPDKISIEELEYFPDFATRSRLEKEHFLFCRNCIVSVN